MISLMKAVLNPALAVAIVGGAASWHAANGAVAAAPAPANRFVCTATKVHDGDGPIWCAERGVDGKPIKIRLTAIAAREIDETCNPGYPCPRATGAAARAALAKLALGRRLRCEATGVSYGRVTAWCWTPAGVELNCAMVKSGTALRWEKYDRQRRLCRR